MILGYNLTSLCQNLDGLFNWNFIFLSSEKLNCISFLTTSFLNFFFWNCNYSANKLKIRNLILSFPTAIATVTILMHGHFLPDYNIVFIATWVCLTISIIENIKNSTHLFVVVVNSLCSYDKCNMFSLVGHFYSTLILSSQTLKSRSFNNLCEFRIFDGFWIFLQGQPERKLTVLLGNCSCQCILRFSVGC